MTSGDVTATSFADPTGLGGQAVQLRGVPSTACHKPAQPLQHAAALDRTVPSCIRDAAPRPWVVYGAGRLEPSRDRVVHYDSTDEYDDELYKGPADKRALLAMTDLEREMILADRHERKQRRIETVARARPRARRARLRSALGPESGASCCCCYFRGHSGSRPGGRDHRGDGWR